MPEEEKSSVPMYRLEEIYDVGTLRKMYENLNALLGTTDEPGLYDNVSNVFGPFGGVMPGGKLLPGLGDGNDRVIPLSYIFETWDLPATMTFFIGPGMAFFEEIEYPTENLGEYLDYVERKGIENINRELQFYQIFNDLAKTKRGPTPQEQYLRELDYEAKVAQYKAIIDGKEIYSFTEDSDGDWSYTFQTIKGEPVESD